MGAQERQDATSSGCCRLQQPGVASWEMEVVRPSMAK
jgi:hypothetical protein